mmetsp:Transcript_35875/g.113447  ORF Transcript_35875/g.113447 Transcript_35875/m.113447 type:complete len:324 (+) Transcript_35875:602-1573(+)
MKASGGAEETQDGGDVERATASPRFTAGAGDPRAIATPSTCIVAPGADLGGARTVASACPAAVPSESPATSTKVHTDSAAAPGGGGSATTRRVVSPPATRVDACLIVCNALAFASRPSWNTAHSVVNPVELLVTSAVTTRREPDFAAPLGIGVTRTDGPFPGYTSTPACTVSCRAPLIAVSVMRCGRPSGCPLRRVDATGAEVVLATARRAGSMDEKSDANPEGSSQAWLKSQVAGSPNPKVSDPCAEVLQFQRYSQPPSKSPGSSGSKTCKPSTTIALPSAARTPPPPIDPSSGVGRTSTVIGAALPHTWLFPERHARRRAV